MIAARTGLNTSTAAEHIALSIVTHHLFFPFGMCEHIAASHSRAGKFLVVTPSLDLWIYK